MNHRYEMIMDREICNCKFRTLLKNDITVA